MRFPKGLRLGLFVLTWAFAACSSTTPDPAQEDAGSTPVPTSTTTGSTPGPDGGTPPPVTDGGTGDSSAPGGPFGDILGTLMGSCGEIRSEITKPTPSIKDDLLDFVPTEEFEKPYLSPGGQTLFDTPNAGGSSGESEVMSFEVLHYCENAKLLKSETQVVYDPPPAGGAASITDILVEIDGKKVGVSVTRAYKPANQGAQTDAEIKTLLEKKLDGILASSARVNAADKWVKQILHVFAATQASADGVKRVWPTIDAQKRADTIVLLTRTRGGGFVYCGVDKAAVGSECP
jgi:hypothetical protein